MKKIVALTGVVALCLSLCGCYDNREIDRIAYVIAIGIDKRDEDYSYTFQVSSPLAMSSGGEVSAPEGGEENSRVQNIVIGGEDLYDARNRLNNFLSKTVNLSHLKMIALSMETAKEGLSSHMTFLLREREVRPNTRLCVTEKKAEDFLRGINPALEANTAEYYDAIAENGSIYAPQKTLREFINENAIFASVLPIGIVSEYEESDAFKEGEAKPMRVSTSKSEFSGLCFIKKHIAVGTLTPEQSGMFGLITGETKEMDLSIEKDGAWHMVRLIPQKEARFTVKQTEEGLTVNMEMSFSAEVNSRGRALDERTIKERLRKEVYDIFTKAQEAGCDIFGAGNYLRQRCKTVSEWESINWDKQFKEAYFMPFIAIESERSNSGTV